MSFVTADSGERLEFDSGMKRDTATGKTNWLLVRPGPMLRRWAELMTRGSVKYESDRKPGELRNWQKAQGEAEYERFLESAARHFEHWLNGTNEIDPETGEPIIEDHAAGVFFNINGAEYVRERSVALTEGLKKSYSQVVLRGMQMTPPTRQDQASGDAWAGTLGFHNAERPACRLPKKGPATQAVCNEYCMRRCIAK